MDSRLRVNGVAVAPTSMSSSNFLYKSLRADAICSCLDSFSGSESDERSLICLLSSVVSFLHPGFFFLWQLWPWPLPLSGFFHEVVSFSGFSQRLLLAFLSLSQFCQKQKSGCVWILASFQNGALVQARGLVDSSLTRDSLQLEFVPWLFYPTDFRWCFRACANSFQ